jgi:enterochelin esterase-like enzyme
VPGTGVLFRAERLPKNARVHYRFWVADVAEPAPSGEATGDLANVAVRDRLEVDPFNPRWEDNAFGARSIWAMPDFHEPEFVRARPAAADPERRREFVWKSDALDNKRPMAVYLPPDFDATSEKRYPLLLVHDGLEYAEDHRGLPRTLDYLIRQGAMEPVIAAFLPPLERNEEYRESEAFPRAIVEELVPMLGRDYPLSDRPGVHACLGLSYGALISAYLCGRWPSLFGRGVFHAGAYAGQAFRRIADRAAAGELHYPGRYFLGCGSFDYLYPHHLILKGVFEGLGVQFLNRETAEGHEWDAWIAADGEALPFVFPPE